MMTTKKSRLAGLSLLVIAASVFLTACGPPGQSDALAGRQLIRSGQFVEAIAPLKKAAQTLSTAPAPSQSKVWNLLGLAYHGARQFDAASEAYGRALKFDRNNVAADYNLGRLRLDQGNMQGAIDYLNTYVMLRPRDPNGYLHLGIAQCHLALERTGLARNTQMEYARRNLETAVKLDPAAPAQNALGILELYRKNPSLESLKAAAAYFQLALARDPHYSPALLNLAILQQRYLNQPGQALQNYQKYLNLGPALPHVQEIAKLAALLELQAKITITPEPHPIHTNPPLNNLAPSNPAPLVAANTPPPVRAKTPLPEKAPPPESSRPKTPDTVSLPPPQQEKPLASNPPPAPVPPPAAPAQVPVETPPAVSSNQNPPAESLPLAPPSSAPAAPRKSITQKINPLHWFSSEPKAKPAAEDAAALAEAPPASKGTRYNYPPRVTIIPGNRPEALRWAAQGAQARQQGLLPDAVLAYQQAVKADPSFYDVNEALGLAALDNRDYPLALEALNRALMLQNDSANARYAFAWTLQRRGYYEDAAHELDKLLAAHPEEVRGHLLLGKLYAEKLNQPKLAREHYARALSLDPQNPQATAIRAWLEQNH